MLICTHYFGKNLTCTFLRTSTFTINYCYDNKNVIFFVPTFSFSTGDIFKSRKVGLFSSSARASIFSKAILEIQSVFFDVIIFKFNTPTNNEENMSENNNIFYYNSFFKNNYSFFRHHISL